MPSIYDDAAQSMLDSAQRATSNATSAEQTQPIAPTPTAQPVNPYEAAADSMASNNASRLRTNAYGASESNPDNAARAKKIAQRTGGFTDAVERNLPQAQRDILARDVDEGTINSPTLRDSFFDPYFTKVAQDDVPVLKEVERAVRRLIDPTSDDRQQSRKAISAVGSYLAEGAKQIGMGATVGLGAGIQDVAGFGLDIASGLTGSGTLSDAAAMYRNYAVRARESMDYFSEKYEGDVNQGIMSGFRSAGTNLTLLPLGMAAGAEYLAGGMALMVGAGSFNKARDKGQSRIDSAIYGTPDAVFEYAFEKIPASRLLADITKHSNLLTMVRNQLVPEIVGEQATTILQDLNEWVRINPEKSVKEFIAERPSAAIQTLMATLVGVGVQSGTVRGVSRVMNSAAEREARVADATVKANQLDQIFQMAAGSNLRGRDAETFAGFVQKVADEGEALSQVHIDADQLTKALDAAGIDMATFAQMSPNAARDLPDAISSGGSVAIPVGDLVGGLGDAGLDKALLPHLRVGENALSLDEAQQEQAAAQQFLQQAGIQVVEQAQQSSITEDSAARVRENLTGQLQATGRFSADVNSAYASIAGSFYTTLAEQLGVTPEQAYAAYPLRVQGAGQGELNQPRDTTGATLASALAAKIAADPVAAEQEYAALPESEGGRILNTDIARELSPEYRADRTRSAEVHEPASEFVKKLYEKKLKQPPTGSVLLTGGGTGAGKSTGLTMLGNAPGAEILFDTTLNAFDSSAQKIDQALASGREVTVVYTYRDPIEALVNGALPRAMRVGRTAPLTAHANSHVGSRNSIERLVQHYANDPRVQFHIIDNSHGPGNARFVSLDTLPKLAENDIESKLHEATQQEFQAGRISQAVAAATLGYAPGTVFADGSSRVGQSEQAFGQREAELAQDAFVRASDPQSPAFKKWFGDSKVVDADGKPLVVYHGTPTAFTEFKTRSQGARDPGFFGKGFYFATTEDEAQSYADSASEADGNPSATGDVMPVYVALQNPFVWDMSPDGAKATRDALAGMGVQRSSVRGDSAALGNADERKRFNSAVRKAGHDGVIVRDEDGIREIIAFEPTQIKSAIGNNGLFDAHDPDILHQSAYSAPDGPLVGLPDIVKVDGVATRFGPFQPARDAAASYMAAAGREYNPPTHYVKVDPERATRIAQAFEDMAHNPNDPAVKAAYQAMIDETLQQWQAIKATGLTVEFIDGEDPYGNPRNAILDVVNNNHLWVFPTTAGFGGSAIDTQQVDVSGNPLMETVPYEMISGRPVQVNDIFRIVHDYFGHIKEGTGFRADGEENAWRGHWSMYSPEARKAMTSETRGQNSWVNFGPYAEFNKTANGGDTQYAPQKIGLLPDWVVNEGATDGEFNQQQPDLFPDELASEASTVDTGILIDTRGDTLQGGNIDSEGKRITATKQGLKNFWNFYGTGPTDDNGAPLVMYHSTRADTNSLKAGVESSNNYGLLGDVTVSRAAVFASPDKAFSQEYLRDGEGQNVMPVYMALKNPVDLRHGISESVEAELTDAGVSSRWLASVPTSWEMFDNDDNGKNAFVDALKKAGYDGAVFNEQNAEGETRTTYAAFEPNQIKSAIGNSGAFDPTNPSILKQGKGDRGSFSPKKLTITLLENADLSTFLHETGHFMLTAMADIASRPDAPARISEDMATILKWFNVPDLAAWNKQTVSEQRANHEKFAESFEQYLFEGKAPSRELQPMFQRFRSWMQRIYQSLQQFMAGHNTQLSDEVRAVFDRMLATDEQIARKNEELMFQQMFTTNEGGFMSDAEFADYMTANQMATGEAIDELQKRSLRDLKWVLNARSKELSKQAADVKKKRKVVEAEVRAEVKAEPVYAVQRWMKTGVNAEGEQQTGAKLHTEDLKAMFGEGPAAPWRYIATNMLTTSREDSLPPDTIAEMFGFTSGEKMVRDIVAAFPEDSTVQGITDNRMMERYGDISSPRAMEDAANAAVHNEYRAKAMATELKAMTQATQPARLLMAAARSFAEQLVGRKIVKQLRPRDYTSAETRAAKRVLEAQAKGDMQGAAVAKRDQVLQFYSAKEAARAVDDIKKAREFFGDIVTKKDDVIGKSRDMALVNTARAILANYGFGAKAKTAHEYLATVREHDPQTFDTIADRVMAAELGGKPFDQLTVDEVRALEDEIKSLWRLSKRTKQIEIDGRLMALDEAQQQLVDRLTDIGIPSRIPGEGHAVTPGEQRLTMMQTFVASLRRVESWVERKDGADNGPFRKLLFNTIKDGADNYRSDRNKYIRTYKTLLESVADSMTQGKIDAGELGYVFGFDTGGIGMAELLHAMLHTGNESNKRKLLLGRKWASENPDGTVDTSRWDSFVQRMIDEGRLTKKHFDFMQGVWDMLESTKPQAQKMHRDVFGKYFKEVDSAPFTTPFGSYRGGYVPAMTDPRVVADARTRQLMQEQNESMANAFPATNKGFTKSRVDYNQPLLLDLRTLSQHLDKVLLFSHLEGPVRDARRLMTGKSVAAALNRIDPTAFDSILTPWLNRAARQQVETPITGDAKLMRLFAAVRRNAGMAAMFANVSNTVQQLTGFSIAATKVPVPLLMQSIAQYIAHPAETTRTVAEASKFMADRMDNEVSAMHDAIEDILLDPSTFQRAQSWTRRHAYFMQAAVDNVMSPMVWLAAYNDALARGMTQEDARRHGDSVIRTTQGSTLPEDVSRIETGNAFVRMFTQFAGYFNMMANTNATELLKISDSIGLKKGAGKALYVLLIGALMPAWIAEAIAQAFKGGPDDEDDDGWYLDDWIKAVFGFGTLRTATAAIPGFGQAVNAAVNVWNKKPYDDRIGSAPAISMIESTVRSPKSVLEAIVADGNKQKAVRDLATAISIFTGLPAAALARPLGYLAGIADDKIDPTGPVDAARGIVTGTASPQSK